jgi:hypothetical protein
VALAAAAAAAVAAAVADAASTTEISPAVVAKNPAGKYAEKAGRLTTTGLFHVPCNAEF